ncbi:MAG: peptidoglycan-binding protein [Paracoccaceae bacterium]|nr:peptidoglycan-binding protein [Paracoccaceae bacterium]
MDISLAIRAAAPAAPRSAIDGFAGAHDRIAATGAIDTPLRAAHLIGQRAHESARFKRVAEALHYRSGARIFAVFGRQHFTGVTHAQRFAGRPEKLASHVYGRRMGNGPPGSGDGFRYRGRGYLQLTGRENYRRFGARIGIDLEAQPERAEEPATAWIIAAAYLAARRRAGRTALEWADLDNVEMVSRIVNGGLNGLDDRRHLTATALTALGGIAARPLLKRGTEGPAVLRLQHLLARAGFALGALDGDFGPRTETALRQFQHASGLATTGKTDRATWDILDA